MQILFPVESDSLSLDFALLHIDLVAAQHDGNVFAHANQITWMKMSAMRFDLLELIRPSTLTMPIRNVLVGNARGDIEHDDATLSIDVVPIS